MPDGALLLRELEDSDSSPHFLLLPYSEAVGVYPCAVHPGQGTRDGREIIERPFVVKVQRGLELRDNMSDLSRTPLRGSRAPVLVCFLGRG